MGLAANVMRGLIEEARFKSFSGTSCTLGRQTMGMTPEAALNAVRSVGLRPAKGVSIEIDSQTISAKGGTILDHSFFALLGFEKTISVDVSDFEGAEIIADLNYPIDPSCENICDLLIDGSLLDNIFDPVTGLRNLTRMVRPGGRILLTNMGNSSPKTGTPYTMFTGAWFYDYFTINNFTDIHVYACCYHSQGPSVYMIDHRCMTREFNRGIIRPLRSNEPMAIVVFAEKGRETTWDKSPTQAPYRPIDEWAHFEDRVEKFKRSKRPPLLHSVYSKLADQYSPGWNLVDKFGRVRSPYGGDVSDLSVTDSFQPPDDGYRESNSPDGA